MKLQGAIFDMDGTLLDSMRIWNGLGFNTLVDMGYHPGPDLDAHLKVLTLRQGAAYCKETYHLPMSADEFADRMSRRVEHFYFHEVLAKPGVKEFLSDLKDRQVPMFVATATDRPLAEAALRHAGIQDYFQGLLTCQEIGKGKESPEIFERAMARIGTGKPDTVIFEDALHAIQTAKSAGFRVAAVYDPSAEEDQREIQALADYYFRSFRELSPQ